MPRRTGKLPASDGLFAYLASLAPGEEPPSLFTIDWQKVERAYNRSLTAEVRDAMVSTTRFFVLSGSSERTGQPIGLVQTIIKACKRRASDLQRVLPSFESEDALHAVFFISKNYSDTRLADGRLFIAFQGFLTSFQLACDAALKEISEFPAVKEGDEWQSWIRSLNRIAK
jgi:prephenate dehydratase